MSFSFGNTRYAPGRPQAIQEERIDLETAANVVDDTGDDVREDEFFAIDITGDEQEPFNVF
jgi:hypothetical protein